MANMRCTGWLLPVVVVFFGTPNVKGERRLLSTSEQIPSEPAKLPMNFKHPKFSLVNTRKTVDTSLADVSGEEEEAIQKNKTPVFPASSSYRGTAVLARSIGSAWKGNPALKDFWRRAPLLENPYNFCYGNCAAKADDLRIRNDQNWYDYYRSKHARFTPSLNSFPAVSEEAIETIPPFAWKETSQLVQYPLLKRYTSRKLKESPSFSDTTNFNGQFRISNHSSAVVHRVASYNSDDEFLRHPLAKTSGSKGTKDSIEFSSLYEPNFSLEDSSQKFSVPHVEGKRDGLYGENKSRTAATKAHTSLTNYSKLTVVQKSRQRRKPILNQTFNSNSKLETFGARPYTNKNINRVHSGNRRKRHFNNIAEIIEAQNERDFQQKRSSVSRHQDDIRLENDYVSGFIDRDETHTPRESFTSLEDSVTKRFADNEEYGDMRSRKALSELDGIQTTFSSRFRDPSLHSKIAKFVTQKFINFGNSDNSAHGSADSAYSPKAYVHPPLTHTQSARIRPLHRQAKSLYRSSLTQEYHQYLPEDVAHQSSNAAPHLPPSSTYASQHSYDHQPYKFGYNVVSPYHGTRYQHKEQKKGKTVTGEYRVKLPDGRVQIVTYTADERGYRPIVRYVRPRVGYSEMSPSAQEHPISYSEFNIFH